MVSLQEIWSELAGRYTSNPERISSLWEETVTSYSGNDRHYHDLVHVETMVRLAFEHTSLLKDLDTLLFSIFYHDIVYHALRKDNEEQSAELAQQRLLALEVDELRIKKVYDQIIATKTHMSDGDSDLNYLLDFDLAALGRSWEAYARYAANVRKEYAKVPNLLYKPGRRKVLKHFLNMDRIYKTEEMFNLYESKARENLAREIDELT
jgi:predicted metal-dependent HD superfamily phosphohydrolase